MDESARLLSGARQLDQDTLAEIYDLYSPGIYRYAWRLLGDVNAAEECVSDTFSRFLGALKKRKGPQNYMKAYLYRIAHNWAVDYWRNCKNEIDISELETLATIEDDPSESAADLHSILLLRKAVNQLTPDQQTVIVLKYLENWDTNDIAKTINKPAGAVKALQHRALNSLRKLLASYSSLNKTGDEPVLSPQQLSSTFKRLL